MRLPRPNRQAQSSRSTVLLGLLCIALLLFSAAVQAIHTHQDGAIHNDCALCITAHVAFAAVTCLAIFLLLQVVAPFLHEMPEFFRYYFIAFVLSCRPPPDSAAVS
jgi:hypothetical protein